MKKFYIFDFDGTLVNTFYDSVIAYNKALKQHGLPEYDFESLETVDYLDFGSKITDDMDVLITYGQILENDKKIYMRPYPNVKEVLKQLVDEGNKIAICSNRIQDQLLEYTQEFFEDIPFTDIIGYVPDGAYKPQPEMMNQILDNVEYKKEEIVYIGDRTIDIETAQNVELDVIIVTWGQGNEETYKHEYPIKVIDDMKELL